MKTKQGFMLRSVAGRHVVVAVGKASLDFNGLITLNETGAYIWEKLSKGCTYDELLADMLKDYEVDEATAREGIDSFLETARGADLIEEWPMKLIVNVSKNWAIGKDGGTLFHIPEDMRFFKSKTVDNTVVMGRKTLVSLPGSKPLPNRLNVVLTHDSRFDAKGAVVCRSLEELKALADSGSLRGTVFVIGGESVYRLLLPLCDTAYVTKVDKDVPDADAFMPDLDEDPEWTVSEVSKPAEHNGLTYSFVTYKRI